MTTIFYDGEVTEPKDGMIFQFSNKATRNFVELQNGSKANGAQAWGWTERTDGNCYRQLWQMKKVDGQYWTFTNISAGTVLDLDHGSSTNGTKVQGWGFGNTDNQKWKIESVETRHDVSGDMSAIVITRSGWIIRNKASNTVLDASGGSPTPGAVVQGWTYMSNNSNQTWRFVAKSITAAGLRSLFQGASWTTGNFLFRTYTNTDGIYLILPTSVIDSIFASTGLKAKTYRADLFDCDDYAFAMKAAVASAVYPQIPMNINGFGIAAGIGFGNKPNVGHAFNLFPSADLKKLLAFEPQDGTWDPNNAFGYTMYWCLF